MELQNQGLVALSTAEEEYILLEGATQAVAAAKWILIQFTAIPELTVTLKTYTRPSTCSRNHSDPIEVSLLILATIISQTRLKPA